MANFRSAATVVSTIASGSSSTSKESEYSTGTSRPRIHDERASRTRHSFFGQSRFKAQSRPGLTSHGASASVQLPTRSRPYTPDTANGKGRKRDTDSLGAIRKSLFGSLKKGKVSSRPTTPNATETLSQHMDEPTLRNTSSLQLSHWHRYECDEEYQRSPKKTRISSPFNFQHVSHAGKELSSALATVHERDLAALVWPAQHPPTRPLQAVHTETGPEQQRAAICSPSPDISSPMPPHTSEAIVNIVARSNHGTVVDEGGNSNHKSDATINGYPAVPSYRLPRRPGRTSSLNVLRPMTPRREPRSPSIIYEDPSPSEHGTTDNNTRAAGRIPADITMALVAMTGKDLDILANGPLPGFMDRTKLPLPPLPQSQLPPARDFVTSLEALCQRPADMGPVSRKAAHRKLSIVSMPAASDTDGCSSSISKPSPWSDCRSPGTPCYSSDERTISTATDATWEDDVDFCYEQEAESTCNFEWEPIIIEHRMSNPAVAKKDGGMLPPQHWFAHSYAPPSSHDSRGSAHPINAAKPNIGKPYHGQPSPLGRHEFLTTHDRSTDISDRHVATRLKLQRANDSGRPRLPHDPTSPVTAYDNASGPTLSSLGALHFESNSTCHNDPKSCGSHHRTSSSYSSSASSALPSDLEDSRDPTATTRWSFGSSTNVPELLPSTNPRNSHSPPSDLPISAVAQSVVLHSAPSVAGPVKPAPLKPSNPLRWRQTSSDRAILHDVGQAVGGGRAKAQKPTRPPRLDEGPRMPPYNPPEGWF